MGSFRMFRPHSIGQTIITFSLIFGAQSGLAQKSKEKKEKNESSKESTEVKASQNFQSGGTATNPPPGLYYKERCESVREDLNRARRDFTDACGAAGLGGEVNCTKKLALCDEIALELYDSGDDISTEFARALGVPQNKISSRCPKYSGQGYFERKDKYEREIKDTNDDLAKIKEENADLKSQFMEDVQKVQEDIADAQKEYQEQVLKGKEQKREQDMKLAENAATTAEKIRNAETTIMMKRQEINNIYASQNSQLIAMNENSLTSACRKKILELKKEYETLMGQSTGDNSTYVQRANQKRKVLQAEWDSCRAQFQVQRKALIEQTEQKVEQAEKVIRDTQSQVDDLKQVLATMNSQATEATNDQNTALTDAQKALQEKIARGTAKLQSLQQTAEEKSKALTEKQQFYQQNSQKLNIAVANLGPIPDDESSTKKISEVSGKYSDYQIAKNDAKAITDANGKPCYSDTSTSSSSSRSSRSREGSK